PESGQVVLRKTKPSCIGSAERETVVNAVRLDAGLQYFRVDVEGDGLVVYIPSQDEQEVERMLEDFDVSPFRRETVKRSMLERSDLCKMLRFTLEDAKARLFQIERWCFRGSIDNWYYLEGGKPLSYLVRKYAKHLGKESFFDLL